MRVLYAYNEPRSGGGGVAGTEATIELVAGSGAEVEVFRRRSEDLPPGLRGRLRAGTSAFYPRRTLGQFDALLERFAPDVVHVFELFPLISPWILRSCARRRIAVVMTCDDYHLTCPVRSHFVRGRICTRCLGGREWQAILHNCRGNIPENVVVAGYNLLFRLAGLYRRGVSHTIAPSEFTRRWLIERYGAEPDRVTTVPYAIRIPPEPVDPAAGRYVAFAGRLVPEKGVSLFLQAARRAGVPVRINRHVKHFVTVPLPDDVEVTVNRGPDDLAAYYRGARLLAMPSLWYETFGIVAAEAMSHGLPVVASRQGALACLVDDGATGLLVDPGDADQLAGALRRLWDDPALARRLGRAAREKACAAWTPRQHLDGVLGAYRLALERRAVTRRGWSPRQPAGSASAVP
ncbi:MAG: glycosyltransferase family 4 protein [Planctomycetes bacterium]|nr:glycosyltransferase family 4 protein [Planctomycetota bacterium]